MWKTEELRDLSEDEKNKASKALELIKGLALNVEIRIKEFQKIVAYTDPKRKTIVLTSRVFNKFTDSEIEVFVAHELGHINYKEQFKASTQLFFCRIGLLAIVFYFIWHFKIFPTNFVLFLVILLLFIFLLLLKSLLHNDEYRADNFAIAEASISAKAFDQCFSKAATILEEEYAKEKCFFVSSVQRLMRDFTHPTVEQRISRVRTLYSTRT